jgi:hypothetical protein
MTTNAFKRVRACAAVLVVGAALTGCVAQPRPLYYWGNYQSEVYSYLKKEESPQVQISKLEETVEKARSAGLALPPGFNAHLGLMYLQSGDAAKAQAAFQAEETNFPESKAYMDFLLKKKAATPVGAAPAKAGTATKPVAAKPAAAPLAPKPAAPKK